MAKLVVEYQTDDRIILAVDRAGKHWTIDIMADFNGALACPHYRDGKYSGELLVEIARDEHLCATTQFEWDEVPNPRLSWRASVTGLVKAPRP
jgi:hypothetical protein